MSHHVRITKIRNPRPTRQGGRIKRWSAVCTCGRWSRSRPTWAHAITAAWQHLNEIVTW